MHLGAEVGAQVGGRRRLGGGYGRREGELVAARLGRPGRVPHRGRRHFGGHTHVGAVVLDRLEHGDRSPELDAIAGVSRGHLGALVRHTDRLCGENRARQVSEATPGAGKHLDRSAVEGEARAAPGRVEVGRRGH